MFHQTRWKRRAAYFWNNYLAQEQHMVIHRLLLVVYSLWVRVKCCFEIALSFALELANTKKLSCKNLAIPLVLSLLSFYCLW